MRRNGPLETELVKGKRNVPTGEGLGHMRRGGPLEKELVTGRRNGPTGEGLGHRKESYTEGLAYREN